MCRQAERKDPRCRTHGSESEFQTNSFIAGVTEQKTNYTEKQLDWHDGKQNTQGVRAEDVNDATVSTGKHRAKIH